MPFMGLLTLPLTVGGAKDVYQIAVRVENDEAGLGVVQGLWFVDDAADDEVGNENGLKGSSFFQCAVKAFRKGFVGRSGFDRSWKRGGVRVVVSAVIVFSGLGAKGWARDSRFWPWVLKCAWRP